MENGMEYEEIGKEVEGMEGGRCGGGGEVEEDLWKYVDDCGNVREEIWVDGCWYGVR